MVARNFEVQAPNQVWAGDVTYIATGEGWAYLAVLLDLFSRRGVGWAMSETSDTELALNALSSHGMNASMSRKRDCWDNAVAKSFFATLRAEHR